ncbi:hypothetical protein D3C74_396100 [compost metagenome]
MSNVAKVQWKVVRQPLAVFGIPRRMMGGIYSARTALRLVLLAFLVRGNGEGFIIDEQHHIRPFLNQRCCPASCFLPELELIPIVSPHLVRLLEFDDLRVSSEYNMNSSFDDITQEI